MWIQWSILQNTTYRIVSNKRPGGVAIFQKGDVYTLKKIICCIYLCLLVYLCNTVALILLSRCSKQSQAYLLNLSTQHILNHRTQTHVVMQLQYIKLTNLKNFVQHGCLVFIK